MKKNRNLGASGKAEEAGEVNQKICRQGITKILLEKYKPARQFTVIDRKQIKEKELKAA